MKSLNKSFATLAIAAAMLLGVAATNATAQPEDGPGYPMQPYGGLSPQQEQEAQKIFVDNYASMEATRQALTTKRMELDQQLASPSPDKGKIEKLSRDIGELRGKMLAARSDVRAKLAQKGLPPDYFGGYPNYNQNYGPGYGYAPCWGGMPCGGWYQGGGWRHHGGHRGYGPRGGCWR